MTYVAWELKEVEEMYEYKCTVARVVDGDTVDLFVDLGFNITIKERFRLEGINAPESRTRDLEEKEAGIRATNALIHCLQKAEHLKVRTQKDAKGKFGRWIGTIYRSVHKAEEPADDSWQNVNLWMVDAGYAVKAEY